MSIIELNGPNGVTARSAREHEADIRDVTHPRALVLLGGNLRSSQFSSAIKRSLLDLPLDAHHTLLDLWRAHGAIHIAYAKSEQLPLRVITNGHRPRARAQSRSIEVTVEPDPCELRGPGGVLRDIAAGYDDQDVIAVANANQILMESLSQLLSSLQAISADLALLAQNDDSPSGLMLARCGSLRAIPDVGYVDLKEQALPMIAKQSSVKVVRRDESAMLQVRTPAEYISALRRYHQRDKEDVGADPFAESWSPVFSLCERGSHVHASARVHDSVVLRGARIGRGAIVVRSVVCPGAVVSAGQVVVDQLVSSDWMTDRIW